MRISCCLPVGLRTLCRNNFENNSKHPEIGIMAGIIFNDVHFGWPQFECIMVKLDRTAQLLAIHSLSSQMIDLLGESEFSASVFNF